MQKLPLVLCVLFEGEGISRVLAAIFTTTHTQPEVSKYSSLVSSKTTLITNPASPPAVPVSAVVECLLQGVSPLNMALLCFDFVLSLHLRGCCDDRPSVYCFQILK